MNLNKITRQIYLVKPTKSTEKIVYSSSCDKKIKKAYDTLGEELMLTTKKFLRNFAYSQDAVKCELMVLNERVRISGVVIGSELRVLRYNKNHGLVEEENVLFLSEYLFEESGIEEGESAVLIKDITKNPWL